MVRFASFLHRILLTLHHFITGSGITTSLISLIANAGQADQAIATAGKISAFLSINLLNKVAVSYLFRSLGSVVGLSVGATLVQRTLRSSLQRKLSGHDVDEVSSTSLHFLTPK